MEMKDNRISMETYRNYTSDNYSNLIETHKKLKGKVVIEDHITIDDCGVYFVGSLLNRDFGRSIVFNYNGNELDFIKSKYLSDYFKDSIKELLGEEIPKKIEDILNSDKDISQMSEEEIKMIYDVIVKYYYNNPGTKSNISSKILTYLYKLEGNGVSAFIKNNINRRDIASQILLTSGLNDRASYYSGRGVMRCDLNEENLVAIFEKLRKLDNHYAVDFVYMVCKMKTLGATEFINSFMNFAINGFKSDNLKTEDKNVSFDGVYGEERDIVAIASIFSAMSRGNSENYQIRVSEQMKESFISTIEKDLREINPEFHYSYVETPNSNEYIKRSKIKKTI